MIIFDMDMQKLYRMLAVNICIYIHWYSYYYTMIIFDIDMQKWYKMLAVKIHTIFHNIVKFLSTIDLVDARGSPCDADVMSVAGDFSKHLPAHYSLFVYFW